MKLPLVTNKKPIGIGFNSLPIGLQCDAYQILPT